MPGKAIYVEKDGSLTVISLTKSYQPKSDEILVAVSYSGVNPADARHARELGIHSTIAGYDFVGTVKAVGQDCHKFKVGDVVAGTTPTEGVDRPTCYGAHQEELLCPEVSAYLVPKGIPLEAAAVTAAVVRSAADGLVFNLGFKLPESASSSSTEKVNGSKKDFPKSILIWGAGSSIGFSAVQIAKQCGAYPIIATSSPQHHARLLELGATRCFDYHSPSVIKDIQSLGAELCGAGGIRNGYDCIGLSGTERGEHMGSTTAACCGENATIVTVIPRPPYLGAWANPERPAFLKPFYLGGETVIATPVDAERAAISMKVLEWVAENYGEGTFVVPNIKIVKGGAENAKAAILEVGKFGSGFTKVAIQHPL